jgi:hypothetical protein
VLLFSRHVNYRVSEYRVVGKDITSCWQSVAVGGGVIEQAHLPWKLAETDPHAVVLAGEHANRSGISPWLPVLLLLPILGTGVNNPIIICLLFFPRLKDLISRLATQTIIAKNVQKSLYDT